MRRYSAFPVHVLLCFAGLIAVLAGQRLPGGVTPVHYAITLTPDLQKASFTGDETIDTRIEKPTTSITLNAADIQFGNVTVTQGGTNQTATVSADATKEMATFTVPQQLSDGPATIHIAFTGTLNDQMKGFYLAKTERRRYAVTQFEATDARRAFACFDEPAYKATFDLSAVVDRDDTGISNGKIVADNPGPSEGKHTLKFQTSPKMSSYLVALAVGNFKCLEGGADGIPIRVCAVPEKVELGHFALTSAEQVMRYYNRYYGIKYPYGKLDLVAVPDFAAGAMENTAAIFYREIDLLQDEKTASNDALKGVAGVAAHEMAHQWFGDLVTMQWWDDIWLNEGFATWMSSKPLKAWKPEWHVDLDEAQETAGALDLDSVASTRPIHAPQNEAETPSQIGALFDGITYEKAAAVLRMVESYLGEDAFRKGVNAYLRQHAYGNATASDFWTAMTESSGKPVDRVMPTFVTQPGAPLVRATERCTGNRTGVQLQQTRFFLNKDLLQHGSPELWQIPMCLRQGAQSATMRPVCTVMRAPQQPVSLNTCAPWTYINAGARGYYRSEYDRNTLHTMLGDAERSLNPAERILLLADEWALVQADQQAVGEYLTAAKAMQSDRTPQVLDRLSGPLVEISERLTNDSDREQYRAFVRNLFDPIVHELGWTPRAGESADARELRATAYFILGYAARDPEALQQARNQAEAYMRDPSSVDPNLVGTVLDLAAINGDATLYDQYVAHMKQAKSPDVYLHYLAALARFTKPELEQRSLELAISSDIRPQDMYYLLAPAIFIPDTQKTAWDFMKSHWDTVVNRAGGMGEGGPRLTFVASAFCDENSIHEVKQFLDEHVKGAGRPLQQSLDRANDCVRLKQQQAPKLAEYLSGQSATAAR